MAGDIISPPSMQLRNFMPPRRRFLRGEKPTNPENAPKEARRRRRRRPYPPGPHWQALAASFLFSGPMGRSICVFPSRRYAPTGRAQSPPGPRWLRRAPVLPRTPPATGTDSELSPPAEEPTQSQGRPRQRTIPSGYVGVCYITVTLLVVSRWRTATSLNAAATSLCFFCCSRR
jgi:hypothetical protein